MFKLASFTDEISQDFELAANTCLEYGVEGLEIRSVWNKPNHELTDDDCKRHITILKNCIALGKKFDCSIVRAFTFWRHTEDLSQVWNKIKDRFGPALDIIDKEKATLAIENENSTYLGGGTVTAKFIDELKHPNVKAIWDPLNALADKRQCEKPFPNDYEGIKPHVVHVHMKDGYYDWEKKALVITPMGVGEIGWDEHFKALVRDGYTGYVSLETHWRHKTSLTDEQKNQPGGTAFSASGEYASRVCLDNTDAILRRIGLRK